MSESAHRRSPAPSGSHLLLVALLLGLPSLPFLADEPDSGFAADTLWSWAWVGDPRLSPDGRFLVYDHIRTDPEADGYSSDIHILDLEAENAAPRPLTSHPASDLGARWSPDGKRIAFVSSRVEPSQIFVLDMEKGGEPIQVTDLDAGAGNPTWSPDGRSIAFTSRAATAEESEREKAEEEAESEAREAARRAAGAEGELETARAEIVIDRLHFRQDGRPGYLPEAYNHLWVVALEGEDAFEERRITSAEANDGAATWSPDGAWLYFVSNRRDDAAWRRIDSHAYRVRVDGSTPITEAEEIVPEKGRVQSLLPSPDGKWVAYIASHYDGAPPSYRESDLYLMTPDGSEKRNLTADYDRGIGDGAGQDVAPPRGSSQRAQWAADSKSLIVTSASEGQADLLRIYLDGRVEPITRLEKGAIHAFSAVFAEEQTPNRVAALYSEPDRPFELYSFELESPAVDAWQRRTHIHAEREKAHAFVDTEELWIESFDSLAIQGWLMKPPGFDAAKKYPMVLYIHGGPHSMYGTGFFHEFQVLAHAGYVVLFANPRGSTGYGTEFGNSIQYRYPGDDYHDLMAMVDAVLERGYVDEKRLGVAGGSGGGLLTTWIIGQTDRFAAAVPQRSVTNWHSFVGTADFNHGFVLRWFRDYPWKSRQEYLERSPLFHVDKVKTPTLLIHSQEDYRTPLEQSLQYYTALRMQQKEARLVIFPDEPHGLSRTGRPSHRIARIGHILDWFDTYLGTKE